MDASPDWPHHWSCLFAALCLVLDPRNDSRRLQAAFDRLLRPWRPARGDGLVHGQERSGGRPTRQPVSLGRTLEAGLHHLWFDVLDRAGSLAAAQYTTVKPLACT